MTTNDRIRYLRTVLLADAKGKKMTLADFGAKISIGGTAVSKIETGETKATERTITTICAVFNVREEWLRDGDGEPFRRLDREEELMQWAGEVLADGSDSFRRRFVKMLAGLTVDEWKILEEKCRELLTEEKSGE